MSGLPSRIDRKATCLASGDQTGSMSLNALLVIWRRPEPSAFITQISSAPLSPLAQAIFLPLGDHSGKMSGTLSLVSWASPDPSDRMVHKSVCPPRSLSNTINPSDGAALAAGAPITASPSVASNTASIARQDLCATMSPSSSCNVHPAWHGRAGDDRCHARAGVALSRLPYLPVGRPAQPG